MDKMYECICGKSHKSRSTVAVHTKKSKSDSVTSVQKPENTSISTTSVGSEVKSGAIKEIDLNGEYEVNMAKINPKKEVAEENECGSCQGKFNGKPKFCPNCGIEFGYEE